MPQVGKIYRKVHIQINFSVPATFPASSLPSVGHAPTVLSLIEVQCAQVGGILWLGGSICDLQTRGRRLQSWLGFLCCGVVLLGKALYPQVHSLDPGVSRYLVGPRRLACSNSWCTGNGNHAVCSPGS